MPPSLTELKLQYINNKLSDALKSHQLTQTSDETAWLKFFNTNGLTELLSATDSSQVFYAIANLPQRTPIRSNQIYLRYPGLSHTTKGPGIHDTLKLDEKKTPEVMLILARSMMALLQDLVQLEENEDITSFPALAILFHLDPVTSDPLLKD